MRVLLSRLPKPDELRLEPKPDELRLEPNPDELRLEPNPDELREPKPLPLLSRRESNPLLPLLSTLRLPREPNDWRLPRP